MNETAVCLGGSAPAIGVATRPSKGANGVGVIFLNAGFTHHVGPQRMHVEFARGLARHGFTSLRFDYSGLGDSPRRAEAPRFADRAVDEAIAAIDHLQHSFGVSRCVLFGLCWGADNALRVGALDSRVQGVVAIDPYSVISIRYFLRFYGPRMLRPRSWANVVAGRSAVARRATQLFSSLRNRGESSSDARDRLPLRSPGEVIGDCERLVERGGHLCLAYAAVGGAYDRYLMDFRRPLTRLAATGRVSVRLFEDSDHVFTSLGSQADLWSYVEGWARVLPRAV